MEKKRGFSTLELLISFVIISFIAIAMFRVVLVLNDKLFFFHHTSRALVITGGMSNNILKDLMENKDNPIVDQIDTCGEDCYDISFKDEQTRRIRIDRDLMMVQYGNVVEKLPRDFSFSEDGIVIGIAKYDDVPPGKANSMFFLRIPIISDIYEEAYNINVVYMFNISTDTVPPIITLVGDDSVIIVQGATYIDDGATAEDNVDGDISANIVVSNPVNTSVIGTYTITYNVVDSAGNPAIQVTRTVDVIEAPIYTFTTGGQTGSTIPTQSHMNTAYAGTPLEGLVTVTGGIQFWTVPMSGNYRIEVWGAQGGYTTGGLGAYMGGTFNLSSGTILKILVGQQGAIGNYGGGYGGGGGTFVTVNNNSPLIIAGGGGGQGRNGSYNNKNAVTGITAQHGYGGCSPGSGGTGGNGGSSGYGSAGGGGGLTTNGGGHGGTAFVNGGAGNSRGGGFGGGGGVASSNGYNGSRLASGAGGGYSGGGGGGHDCDYSESIFVHEGGGGGSYNIGTNPTSTAATRTGNGEAVINFLGP